MLYDTGLSYRKTAIEGASAIGLVIALYDTLWGDLHRASEALRTNNIEARCNELNHAFLVLGQLESWVAPENGGDLAESLTHFYRYLRAKMMEASLRQSSKILGELMDLILHVRSAWQQRDTNPIPLVETPVRTQPTLAEDLAHQSHRIALSFSA
jgi:flagellar biosynthetic protein FliS